MYKHILVPTDGSELSDKAVEAAIKLAKLAGARITAFHAVEPYPLQGAYAAEASGVAELQPEIFAERSEEYAKRVLDAVARTAAAANVQCTTAYATSRHRHRDKKRRCLGNWCPQRCYTLLRH